MSRFKELIGRSIAYGLHTLNLRGIASTSAIKLKRSDFNLIRYNQTINLRKLLFNMALKKSELYSSLWKSCDELRGGMDTSQYKDYVLVLLFMKYVSDKYAGDTEGLIEVPEGGSFADMVAAKGDKEIGDKCY